MCSDKNVLILLRQANIYFQNKLYRQKVGLIFVQSSRDIARICTGTIFVLGKRAQTVSYHVVYPFIIRITYFIDFYCCFRCVFI